MIFRWNFQDCGNGTVVAVYDMPDNFGNILIDQNDVNIVSLEEALEAFFNFTDGSICRKYVRNGGNLMSV